MDGRRSVSAVVVVLSVMLSISVAAQAQPSARFRQSVAIGEWYELLWTGGQFQIQVYYSAGKPAVQVYHMQTQKVAYTGWLVLDQPFGFTITLASGEKPTYACTPRQLSASAASLDFAVFHGWLFEQTVTANIGEAALLPWADDNFVFMTYTNREGKPRLGVFDYRKDDWFYTTALATDVSGAFVVAMEGGEDLVYSYTPTAVSPTSATVAFRLVGGTPREWATADLVIGKSVRLPWAGESLSLDVFYSEGKPALRIYDWQAKQSVYTGWLALNQPHPLTVMSQAGEKLTYVCTPTKISATSVTLHLSLHRFPMRWAVAAVEVGKPTWLPWAGDGFVYGIYYRDGKHMFSVFDYRKNAWVYTGSVAKDAARAFVAEVPGGENLVYRLTPTALSPTSATVVFELVGGTPLTQESRTREDVHFWISNQSLGPGVPREVRMAVSLWVGDSKIKIFDRVMAVLDQHNVAFVEGSLPKGTHRVWVEVGDPYRLSTEAVVEVTGESWVFVRFWFDPESVYEGQWKPKITVDVFERPPGVK